MEISNHLYDFIRANEGFSSNAYRDSGGVPTIGYGTIYYPNGEPVRIGDKCNRDMANIWLMSEIEDKAKRLLSLRLPKLTQGQFEAILDFCYNLGFSAFKNSLLYRKILENPMDESIYKYKKDTPAKSCEFLRWIYDNGKIIPGLINRRVFECDLYIK